MSRSTEESVRQMLRSGKLPTWVANASGWPLHRVQQLAREAAAAPAANGTSSTAPQATPPSEVATTPETDGPAELFARAERIGDPQIQSTLARARKALADLTSRVKAYDEKAQLRARVAHLEEQLAAAKSELRGPRRPRVESQGGGSSDASPIDNRAIREWARENNVECPAVGRVPRTVADAWKAAHSKA